VAWRPRATATGQISWENDMMRSVLFTTLLALSATAGAQGFDYNYIQASYQQVEYDDFDDDGDGLGLDVSFALSDNFHLFGGYAGLDVDTDVDTSAWHAGVGLNGSISALMDVVIRLSYETQEIDLPGGGTLDNDGYGLSAGVRVGANEWIELYGSISYVDRDSGSETGLDAGFLFNIGDAFAVGLGGYWDDDITAYSLNGRLYFN
jgi:hypothetical protein